MTMSRRMFNDNANKNANINVLNKPKGRYNLVN